MLADAPGGRPTLSPDAAQTVALASRLLSIAEGIVPPTIDRAQLGFAIAFAGIDLVRREKGDAHVKAWLASLRL